MKNAQFSYPTDREMRALEVAARRARAREVARLIDTGVAGLKALAERLGAAVHGAGRIGHA